MHFNSCPNKEVEKYTKTTGILRRSDDNQGFEAGAGTGCFQLELEPEFLSRLRLQLTFYLSPFCYKNSQKSVFFFLI